MTGCSPTADDVIDFWLGPPAVDGSFAFRTEWFEADPAFDRDIRDRLGAVSGEAVQGGLGAWAMTPLGSLALVLLLDQVPRNIHRGTAAAFAGDERARAIAAAAIAEGDDEGLPVMQRLFLYLPFEHSENLEDQDRCCALMASLGNAKLLDYAHRHRDVIARFGRFPHRNEVLGRINTPAEQAFLRCGEPF